MSHTPPVIGPGPIGSHVLRREDAPLLTGLARFVDDLAPPGCLHVKLVRSSLAHAKIRSIDTAEAAGMTGVVAVLTAADLPVKPQIPPVEHPDVVNVARYALAVDKVRFAGEAVAAVVATSPYLAEDAREAVRVDMEPLPVLLDAVQASTDGATLLHDAPSNVLLARDYCHGDVENAFAEAEVVIERTFRHARVSAVPLEPRGVLAVPDGRSIQVTSSLQVPHRLADVLAHALDLDPALVRVTSPDIGGAFGQKGHVYPEDILISHLALRLNRAVAWTEDRTENLTASSHARDQAVTVRLAATADGRLLAMSADVLSDIGAYPTESHGPLLEAGGTPSMIPGPYRVPAYRYRTRAVCTNKCPLGAYRGVGLPMAVLSHERMLDILATELDLDAAEVRRRNLIRPDEMPYRAATGRLYDNGDYPRALESALKLIAYDDFEARRAAARERGRLAGIGLASFVEFTGVNRTEYLARGMMGTRGDDSAHAVVDSTGSIRLWTTLPGIGNGSATTFAQIAAHAFGCSPARIVVERSDTAVAGMVGNGTGASRSMVSGGGAVWNAVAALRAQIDDALTDALGGGLDEFELREGTWAPTTPRGNQQRITHTALSKKYGPFEATALFEPPQVVYSYATHAAVVEVDPTTGHVEVVDYAVVDDCGRIVNHAIVEGQVRGAVVQGIGAALYERHSYDAAGQLQTASFMDYLVPTATDVPNIRIESYEIPTTASHLGVKGIGESGTLGAPAAIANAVSDAVGVEFNELPIQPPAVLDAIESRGADADRPATDTSARADGPARPTR